MGNASSSSSSSSAKRQAERHAREERKREFAAQQEREERARAEREEVLARIRALLDENNAFDPLTDDDRAALARHCRRVVAMPGERVMHWRPKRERQALRMRREAAEAERELERERRGMAPMRDEDHEFDPDAALYVVAEGAVDVVAYRADDDDDDDDGEGDGVHGAFERAARDPPPPNAGEVAVTLRRGACFGELEKIFGASPNLRAAVVAVDPNDRRDSDPRNLNPDPNPKPAPNKPGAVLWAVDGRLLRRKKAFKAMVESMRAQVAAWRPLLDGVGFFADATDAMQRSFLACVLRTTTFRPREAVAKEGDECAGAWMVMEGEAHAMAKLVGGDERWVAGYWPGDGFGFNSLVWGHGTHLEGDNAFEGDNYASEGDKVGDKVERCLAFEATMRCGEDVDGTELAFVGRETFARMFEKSTRSWRRMRRTALESAARVVETRESKRPAPLRPGDPNIARMIAAMAAAAADDRGDGGGGGGGGGGDSPRPRTPRTPSPRRGRSPPPPPLVERQSADPTRVHVGRHMPDELLYPEEFETESEGEGEGDENGHENALPGAENAGPEHRGDETPRVLRAGGAGRGGGVRSGRDARGEEEELRRRRRRDGKGSAARDANRPVRRREPLGPNPRGPTRLARLVAALESHPAFEGAERAVLSAAVQDMESCIVPPGKPLYRHGAKGDYLYVVEAGTLDVMAPNPTGVGSPRTVGTVGPGGVVGDVALTFATTREHTARAGPVGAKVWGMRRCWFERTAGRAVHGRRRLIRRFVHDVPILRGLPVHEQYACAEGFREALFAPGDVVIRQGDEADYFYILEEGGAKCSVRLPGEREQFPVAQYGAGSYFGELEFLGDVRKGAGGEKKPSETVGGGGGSNKEWRRRKATVTATTALRCAAIEGARFAELVAEGTELRRRMVREARTYVNSIH